MMQWIPTRIGVRGQGPSVTDGVQAQCGNCGTGRWILFGLGTGTAPHAQCVDCGAVYCLHPGDCEAFRPWVPAGPDDSDTVHPFVDQERG